MDKYQAPGLQPLLELPLALEAAYKNGNHQRLNFIKLAKSLAEQDFSTMPEADAVKIMMGLYLMEMEHIENQCHVLSPKRSTLYYKLHTALNISKTNELSFRRKLIYLNAFYQYVSKSAPRTLADDTKWASINCLKDEIIKVEKALLDKQVAQVQCVIESLPAPQMLLDKLTNMSARYKAASKEKAAKSWFSSGETYVDQAAFLDLIDKYCMRYLPRMQEHMDPSLEYTDLNYMTRMGSAVYTMKYVEGTYYVNNGTTSTLHKMCQMAICPKIKSAHQNRTIKADEISLGRRINWLTALSNQVRCMLTTEKEFVREQAGSEQAYNKLMRELQVIDGNISRYLGAYTQERDAPSRLESNMTMATSSMAQYTINNGIKTLVGGNIPTPLGMVIDSVAGATGFAVLGPGGAVLGTTLSRLVRDHVIPMATAGLFSGAIDRVSMSVGSTLTGIVILPFRVTASGLSALHGMCTRPSFDPSEVLKDEEYIHTLLELPDDVLPADIKEIIQNVVGHTNAPSLMLK